MFSRAVLMAREAWSSPEFQYDHTLTSRRTSPAPITLFYTGPRPGAHPAPIGPATLAGGNGARATPVPIPNTVVKPRSADGTARETEWESTSSPALYTETPRHTETVWRGVSASRRHGDTETRRDGGTERGPAGRASPGGGHGPGAAGLAVRGPAGHGTPRRGGGTCPARQDPGARGGGARRGACDLCWRP